MNFTIEQYVARRKDAREELRDIKDVWGPKSEDERLREIFLKAEIKALDRTIRKMKRAAGRPDWIVTPGTRGSAFIRVDNDEDLALAMAAPRAVAALIEIEGLLSAHYPEFPLRFPAETEKMRSAIIAAKKSQKTKEAR